MKFRITNADTAAVTAYLQRLSPDKEYDVTVSIHRRNRTIPQNSLYWLHVSCIADETGSDRDEVHAELKRLYLPYESVTGMYGETIVRPVSTTNLDTAQFSAYIEKVVSFAASTLGIVLPMPGDLAFEEFEEYYKNRI